MESDDDVPMSDSGNGSDDFDDVDLCLGGPTPQISKPEKALYDILSVEEVMQYMNDYISAVNLVVQIPAVVTRILLQHFRWDKETFMERYFDSDQEALFKEARVISPFIDQPESPSTLSGPEECTICLIGHPPSMMTGLQCGHRFCTECWVAYLTTKITQEGEGESIACAAHSCEILVDDATVMRLLSDARVKVKYQQLITNSFVECNPMLRWCPKPDCNHCIKSSTTEAYPVRCKCEHTFCSGCMNSWHKPVRCHFMKAWIEKCDKDSGTYDWIGANTKACPTCKASIEKRGGCNHMTCTSCHAQFCWVCLGTWMEHKSPMYACHRFDKKDAKEAVACGDQENGRSRILRDMFFISRYVNHMESLRLEQKVVSVVADKMVEMQQNGMSWIEVQFLKDAVDILCQCRQTLMYTYVFVYYLERNNQLTIFEDNQRDLESATEELSWFLEGELHLNLFEIKQNIQDKSRYCHSRRSALLDHVEEGYEHDWWVHTVDDESQK